MLKSANVAIFESVKTCFEKVKGCKSHYLWERTRFDNWLGLFKAANLTVCVKACFDGAKDSSCLLFLRIWKTYFDSKKNCKSCCFWEFEEPVLRAWKTANPTVLASMKACLHGVKGCKSTSFWEFGKLSFFLDDLRLLERVPHLTTLPIL